MLPRFRSLSLGYLPRFSDLNISERHLGLLTIEENVQMTQISDAYLKSAEETLDLRPLTTKFESSEKVICKILNRLKFPRTIRLGVAKDKAFCFYYQQNLNFLEDAGAELVYFSPLEDTELPQDLDGLYLGGGYPENFARQLTENDEMRFQILRCAQMGMPIYAECGGLIYVCEKLLFEDKSAFSMVGIFPYTIKWDKNYLAIRYVEIRTTRDTILGPKGLLIKGQEFHQTRLLDDLEQQGCCYEVRSSTNEQFLEGLYTKNVLASYMHLYFPSEEKIANQFVFQCKKYQQEKHVYSKT